MVVERDSSVRPQCRRRRSLRPLRRVRDPEAHDGRALPARLEASRARPRMPGGLVQAWMYVLGKWPDYLSAAAGAAVQPSRATAGELLRCREKKVRPVNGCQMYI